MVPRKLRDVDKTIDTTKVDKCTKVDDRRNGTFELHTWFKLVENLRTLGFTCSLKHNATRKNNVVAVAIHFDNTALDALAHKCRKIFYTAKVNQGRRQETTKTDVEDKTTLNNFDNFTLNVNASFELLFNCFPCTLVLSAFLRKNKTTFFVFLLKNKCFDGVAQRYEIFWVYIFANGKLASRNDAFGFKSDVKQNLIMLNFDNGSRYQIALVEIGDSTIDKAA